MRKAKGVDQSGFPPSLQVSFYPNTSATWYVVEAVPFRSPGPDSRRVVDRGFLDVDLPGLAGLGLSETLDLLQDKLHHSRARVSADGGGHPAGSHRWSQATLPGL